MASEDYPEEASDLVAAVAREHFWFHARNEMILATLRRVKGRLEGLSVLDAGCGTGSVLAAAERAGMTGWGLDMHRAALLHARRLASGRLLRTTLAQVPFRGQFDVVLLCDVIEHMDEDDVALRDAATAARHGGILLVTVPALPFLWTPVDEVSGHKRRYTRASLVAALERAGLKTRSVRYFNVLTLPLQLAQRRALRARPTATASDRRALMEDALKVPFRPLNRLLEQVSRLEIPLSRLVLPIGASLIAVASPSGAADSSR